MNKAQEILSLDVSQLQKCHWAEGNAVALDQDSSRNTTVYQYADGSAIKRVGATLTVV
ncbi:hypothetical protein [Paraburkholderia sp.]|jgi:hypothetical protein|uniref:hypothetical protein n=1 Tax=Paraburkholderia sp. TaxID=1926495 RepID=UPI003C7AEEA7